MDDGLGTFADQQHQELTVSPKDGEKSRVGIKATTSRLDHGCSTN